MPKNAFRPAQRRRVSRVTPEKALVAHAGYATPGFAAPKLHASCDRPSRFTLRGGAASPSDIAAPRLFSRAAANAAWCSCGSSCGTAKDGGARSERARHRVLPFRRYGLLTWQSGRHRRPFGAALGPPTRGTAARPAVPSAYATRAAACTACPAKRGWHARAARDSCSLATRRLAAAPAPGSLCGAATLLPRCAQRRPTTRDAQACRAARLRFARGRHHPFKCPGFSGAAAAASRARARCGVTRCRQSVWCVLRRICCCRD